MNVLIGARLRCVMAACCAQVYEDIFDAKQACDHLSGFNVAGRYLVVLYYQASRAFAVVDRQKKKDELERMKAKYDVDGEDHSQKPQGKKVEA